MSSIKITNKIEKAFLQDFDTKYQYLEGVLSTGKTFKLALKAYLVACNREPNNDGNRMVKVLIVRRNAAQLRNGIYSDFVAFFRDTLKIKNLKITSSQLMSISFTNLRLPDGTTVSMQMIFQYIESHNDLGKINGTGYTFCIFDEANELLKVVVEKTTERAFGREASSYIGEPPKEYHAYFQDEVGNLVEQQYTEAELEDQKDNLLYYEKNKQFVKYKNWSGVMITANAPETNNWVTQSLVQNRMLDEDGNEISAYYRLHNPIVRADPNNNDLPSVFDSKQADYQYYFTHKNIKYYGDFNHYAIPFTTEKSLSFWKNLIITQRESSYMRTILGYHQAPLGKSVIFVEDFTKENLIPNHEIEYTNKLPLFLSFDFGLAPACVVAQPNQFEGVDLLEEIFHPNEMSFLRFLEVKVKPYLLTIVKTYPKVLVMGDPTGYNKQGHDASDYYEYINTFLLEMGISAYFIKKGDSTFKPKRLIEATQELLGKKGGLRVKHKLRYLIDGFTKGYVYNINGDPDKKDNYKLVKEREEQNNIVDGEHQTLKNYTHLMDCMLQIAYLTHQRPDLLEEGFLQLRTNPTYRYTQTATEMKISEYLNDRRDIEVTPRNYTY